MRQSYAASGASHVLALSGLHLGVIYGLLSLIFVHRRMRVLGQVLAMVAIWAYAALVGMPPSVLRSATMLTLFAFVVLTGRRQVSAQYACICRCVAVGGQSVGSLGCRIPNVVSCCAWHRDAQYAIEQC